MGGPDRQTLVLRGVLDLCLLALLDDGPVYGYELSKRLADRGLDVGTGTAYPLLARMERIGAVTSSRQPSTNGPSRKYYALSTSGRRTLAAGRQEWATITSAVAAALEPEKTDRSTGRTAPRPQHSRSTVRETPSCVS